MSEMSEFARRENERASDWLTRLISVNAPADIRADVRAILQAETHQAQPQAGKYVLIPNVLRNRKKDC